MIPIKHSLCSYWRSDKKVSIKHLEIENPSEKIINGKYLQGGLSLYNFNEVTIDDLKIKNSEGEDGMNIKNANLCNLKNIFIQNAKFDAIDIDNCNTIAKNIKLENFNTKDDNGDGLDFYFSKASLKNIKLEVLMTRESVLRKFPSRYLRIIDYK